MALLGGIPGGLLIILSLIIPNSGKKEDAMPGILVAVQFDRCSKKYTLVVAGMQLTNILDICHFVSVLRYTTDTASRYRVGAEADPTLVERFSRHGFLTLQEFTYRFGFDWHQR